LWQSSDNNKKVQIMQLGIEWIIFIVIMHTLRLMMHVKHNVFMHMCMRALQTLKHITLKVKDKRLFSAYQLGKCLGFLMKRLDCFYLFTRNICKLSFERYIKSYDQFFPLQICRLKNVIYKH
jgi:hypothetical protein